MNHKFASGMKVSRQDIFAVPVWHDGHKAQLWLQHVTPSRAGAPESILAHPICGPPLAQSSAVMGKTEGPGDASLVAVLRHVSV